MVLFFHNTSNVPGDPHQDLLREKTGRMAWPTLLFLDHEGEVVHQHTGPRTVEGFTTTLGAIEAYRKLKPRVEAGDEDAEPKYFWAQVELGRIPFSEARERRKALGDRLGDRAARVDQLLVNMEVDEVLGTVRGRGRDREALAVAGRNLARLKAEGRIPTEQPRVTMFWNAILTHAEAEGNADLFAEGVEALKALLGDRPGAARGLGQLEERLRRLRGDG